MNLNEFLQNAKERLGENLGGQKVLRKKEGDKYVYQLANVQAAEIAVKDYGWEYLPTPPPEAVKPADETPKTVGRPPKA